MIKITKELKDNNEQPQSRTTTTQYYTLYNIIIIAILNITHIKADLIADPLLMLGLFNIHNLSKPYFMQDISLKAIRVSYKYKPTAYMTNDLISLKNKNVYSQSISIFHSPQKTSHRNLHSISIISLEKLYSTNIKNKFIPDMYSLKFHNSYIANTSISNLFGIITIGLGLSQRSYFNQKNIGISSEFNAGFIYKFRKNLYLQLGNSLFATKWYEGEYYLGADFHIGLVYGNI